MPINPEKHLLVREVQASLDSQFWSSEINSARNLTGVATTAPCEAPPLNLAAPSGINRVQFLTATRSARVPFFPGYCAEQGGLVRCPLHARMLQPVRPPRGWPLYLLDMMSHNLRRFACLRMWRRPHG